MTDGYDRSTDEILGITRCARCGHRLDGEIACPVCSGFDEPGGSEGLSRAVFFVACFLTSPVSLPVVWRSGRLSFLQRIVASAGALLWLGLWLGSA